MIGNAERGALMWTDHTDRKVARFCAEVCVTTRDRDELVGKWRAQYVADREAYLATLPDISRMGRMIWLHARRQAARA